MKLSHVIWLELLPVCFHKDHYLGQTLGNKRDDKSGFDEKETLNGVLVLPGDTETLKLHCLTDFTPPLKGWIKRYSILPLTARTEKKIVQDSTRT